MKSNISESKIKFSKIESNKIQDTLNKLNSNNSTFRLKVVFMILLKENIILEVKCNYYSRNLKIRSIKKF